MIPFILLLWGFMLDFFFSSFLFFFFLLGFFFLNCSENKSMKYANRLHWVDAKLLEELFTGSGSLLFMHMYYSYLGVKCWLCIRTLIFLKPGEVSPSLLWLENCFVLSIFLFNLNLGFCLVCFRFRDEGGRHLSPLWQPSILHLLITFL